MKLPKPTRLKSGNWNIYLRLGGESYSVTEPTKNDCIAHARRIKAEYLDGKIDLPNTARKYTLKYAIELYENSRPEAISPETLRKFETIKKNHYPELMGQQIGNITKMQWQAALDAMLGRYARKTVTVSFGVIKSVLRYFDMEIPEVTFGKDFTSAIKRADGELSEEDRAQKNLLAKQSEGSAEESSRVLFLQPDEILRFVEAAKNSKYEIPLLLALSSLRIAEIDGLDWSNVLKTKILVREVSVRDKNNRKVKKTGAKNESSVRNVDIFIPSLQAAIDRARKPSGAVLECCQQTLRRECARVCKKAGVPVCQVHSLRHSYASLCAYLGISEQVSMKMGGWANDKIMKSVYTHVVTESMNEGYKKLSDFYSAKEKSAAEIQKPPDCT